MAPASRDPERSFEEPPTETAPTVVPRREGSEAESETAAPREKEREGKGTKVCLILPLSGPHGALGSWVLRRMEEALRAASVPGWEVRDDQGTEGGVAEAASWARDGGCGIWIGGIGDRESRALAKELRGEGVSLIGLWSSPPVPDDAQVIGTTPDRRAPMRILARFLEDVGARRVFLLVGPTPGDRDRATAFQQRGSGIGTIVRVEASGDPRSSATALAEAMRSATSSGGCVPDAVVLIGDPDRAVRWKGFLESEGVLQARKGCGAPLLVGPPSWAAPEAVRRYGMALDGAITAAWRGADGSPVTDPLVLGTELAVAAVMHHLRYPARSGWEGLERPLGPEKARYVGGRWLGIEPALLRIEGMGVRWIGPADDASRSGQ